MKSIITDSEFCYICGKQGTEMHHIFGGSNRKWSEKYGLKIPLCHWCHNEPPNGVHFNPEVMRCLHEIGQSKFEEAHTREEFVKIFGRNYL